jgi:hypothetical protein
VAGLDLNFGLKGKLERGVQTTSIRGQCNNNGFLYKKRLGSMDSTDKSRLTSISLVFQERWRRTRRVRSGD